MILAINIGNTNTRFALEHNTVLRRPFRFDTPSSGATAVFRSALASFFRRERTQPGKVEGAVLCSVVPVLNTRLRNAVKKYMDVVPLVVTPELDIEIRLHYDKPATLGSDRICAALAGYHRYGGPVIVIDFGTATTYNIVSAQGDFLGGLIAPGVGSAFASLHANTAKLPTVSLTTPKTLIGTSTVTGIESGVVYTMLGGLEGIVTRIKGMLGEHAIVVATGGFAGFMAEHGKCIDHVEPDLVLEGACLIYRRIRGVGI